LELARHWERTSRTINGDNHFDTIQAQSEIKALQSVLLLQPASQQAIAVALRRERDSIRGRATDERTEYHNLGHTLQTLEQELSSEHIWVAQALGRIASYHVRFREYEQGLEAVYRAKETMEREYGPTHPITGSLLLSLASCQRGTHNYAAAEAQAKSVLQDRESTLSNNDPRIADAIMVLAAIFLDQDRRGPIESLLHRAVSIREEAGDQNLSTSIMYLAKFYASQGQFEEASLHYERCLQLRQSRFSNSHPSVAQAMEHLAALRSLQGRYEDAEKLYRTSLPSLQAYYGRDHPRVLGSIALYGDLLARTGRSLLGKRLIHDCLTRQVGALPPNHPDIGLSTALLARTCLISGEPDKADALLDEAVGIFEDARYRSGATADARAGYRPWDPYMISTIAKLALGQEEAALERLDQARGRFLQDLLKENAPVEPVNHSEDIPWHDMVEQASKCNLLDNETAIVGWFDHALPGYGTHNEHHLAFVLRNNGSVHWESVLSPATETDSRPDAQIANALYGNLSKPSSSTAEWAMDAYTLYRRRFSIVEKHLEGVTRLVVIPTDSPLVGLPLNVLLTRKPGDFNDLRYLGERYEITYGASLASLVAIYSRTKESRKENTNGIVAFGNPQFTELDGGADPGVRDHVALTRSRVMSRQDADNGHCCALPESETEVRAIVKLVPGSRYYVSAEASEETLWGLQVSGQLQKYKYIHFATHGVIDDIRPEQSALLLANSPIRDPPHVRGGTEKCIWDGVIRSEEVSDYSVGARAVVMTACRSAGGTPVAREGYIGLSHAWHKAGAGQVIVSLWNVSDLSTAILMEEFYRRAEDSHVGAALAEAMRHVRNMTLGDALSWCESHGCSRFAIESLMERERAVGSQRSAFSVPYYWAGCIVMGM
jgi:CHAT domain-containing protein